MTKELGSLGIHPESEKIRVDFEYAGRTGLAGLLRGEGNLVVWYVTGRGSETRWFDSNDKGPYFFDVGMERRRWHSIKPGPCIFEVEADGEWSLTITIPTGGPDN